MSSPHFEHVVDKQLMQRLIRMKLFRTAERRASNWRKILKQIGVSPLRSMMIMMMMSRTEMKCAVNSSNRPRLTPTVMLDRFTSMLRKIALLLFLNDNGNSDENLFFLPFCFETPSKPMSVRLFYQSHVREGYRWTIDDTIITGLSIVTMELFKRRRKRRKNIDLWQTTMNKYSYRTMCKTKERKWTHLNNSSVVWKCVACCRRRAGFWERVESEMRSREKVESERKNADFICHGRTKSSFHQRLRIRKERRRS